MNPKDIRTSSDPDLAGSYAALLRAARSAEASNRTLYVLTVVTMLALPINVKAGLVGIKWAGFL
jgi:Mg2+ and Co2+ transporter CorA